MDKRIIDYFEAHRGELLEDISRLVAVKSVFGEAAPGAPYGAEPRRALDTAAEILRGYGFEPEIIGDRILVCDWGAVKPCVGIIAHLDVVPAGDGWTATEPFTMREKDGIIYGRGVSDDKGPAVAAIYALRALRDLGIVPKSGVRLIFGSCEEVDMRDIAWYAENYEMPPVVFSPDSEFPLVNTEKGRLAVNLSASCEPVNVLSITGGSVVNAVPEKACANLRGISPEICEKTLKNTVFYKPVSVQIQANGDEVAVICTGKTAHAAHAEQGANAVCGLISALCALPISENERRIFGEIEKALPITDVFGDAIGAAASDFSGALTINLGLADAKEGKIEFKLDCRLPVCASADEILRGLTAALPDYTVTETVNFPPHHVPEDSELVVTLMDIFNDYTGERLAGKRLKPVATGGLTYVHNIPGAVAFGCEFPDFPTNLHGPDEKMSVSDLLLSGEMFAEAIYRLCG